MRAEIENSLRITGRQVAAVSVKVSLVAVETSKRQTGKQRPVVMDALNGPNGPAPEGKNLLGEDSIALVLDRERQIAYRYGPITDGDARRLLADMFDKNVWRTIKISPGGEAIFPFTRAEALPDSARALTDYLFYATLLRLNDDTFGTVILGAPRADLGPARQLLLTLLVAGLATLLVAAAGGYWLADKAMRPVRLITHAANAIGETELSRRLNVVGQDELAALAATFDRMLDRLETAFKRQRQFASDASHELRTPLTIVQLEVDRALACVRTPEEYTRVLSVVQAENEWMTHLVNDLLLLARADAGRATPRREPVDLSDLALDVVERLAPLAQKKHVALSLGTLAEITVDGDCLYLSQMLTNLVQNAIIYTSGIGGRVCVEIGLRQRGQVAHGWVRVEDDGPGIAPAHLPHLFDRFYRVDQARVHAFESASPSDGEPGGSGLGLAIVRWVAQTHGGDVQVRSEVGRGSVFEVWLPARQDSLQVHDMSPDQGVLSFEL